MGNEGREEARVHCCFYYCFFPALSLSLFINQARLNIPDLISPLPLRPFPVGIGAKDDERYLSYTVCKAYTLQYTHLQQETLVGSCRGGGGDCLKASSSSSFFRKHVLHPFLPIPPATTNPTQQLKALLFFIHSFLPSSRFLCPG